MTMGDRICIMNLGEVVQIGRPLEVYRNPADTFVARFLGNPPMNLLKGRLEARGGRAVACFAGCSVELTARVAASMMSMAPYFGREVIVGIRPEDFYEIPPAGAPLARLPASVAVVEPLGAETLLVLASTGADGELIARIGRDTTLRGGDRLEIALDPAAIHLFDPVTTKAIV